LFQVVRSYAKGDSLDTSNRSHLRVTEICNIGTLTCYHVAGVT